MKLWYHCDMNYPYRASEEKFIQSRVATPNHLFDPRIGSDLYNRYLQEFRIADEEGLGVMVNEHHQTSTCISASAPLILGILAATTKKARLLILGNPLPQRLQPIRVAEEMAMIDVISHGRLECGFVRGVPFETAPSNANPVRMSERFWEAHDLILKAWTTHDGPFSFEGKYHHYRAANIWPRPYQEPHPPVWITGTSPSSVGKIGEHGYVVANFGTGYAAAPAVFSAYREGWARGGHRGAMPLDRLAYCGLCYVGATDEEGRAGAEKVMWYYNRPDRTPQHFSNPPGYLDVNANTKILRSAAAAQYRRKSYTLDDAIEKGLVFCGNADTVFKQIKRFYDHVGGFGHFLAQAQGGFLDHEETSHGIRMMGRELYPRLQDFFRQKAAA
jgi:alkanesulfonate monooxygenase SsuD/methylene tetrahydromethanopterin reductase-like flavin-dependent oxidoreductase (luciferase family)